MRLIKALGAVLLALSFATGSAPAMPQAPAVNRDKMVAKVAADCHQDARLHYLPQDGRKVWHRHRQSDCKVVLVDPPQEAVDCHQDARLHYLPEYGRRVWHRHRQSNCRVVIVDREEEYDERPRDCHRDVRRHYLPEYGRSIYHKHVGESCRIRIYNQYQDGGQNRPGCIKIGPVTLCEN